jgi:chemotaxis signal transduction protein
MKSFVIFSVLGQNYGVDIESVKRILPGQELTEIPDEGSHIQGMFQYEDNVLKVLSFRKAIEKKSYEEELELKAYHEAWIDALKQSVETGEPFTKGTESHTCPLGKWIDSFQADDEEVLLLMKKLSYHHQNLYSSAIDVLQKRAVNVDDARKMLEVNVKENYKHTLEYIDKIAELSAKVAAELQRCMILEGKDGSLFGLNIDEVEDIVHIEDAELHEVKEAQYMGDFMNVAAILSHNKQLVTIIKDITLEQRGA